MLFLKIKPANVMISLLERDMYISEVAKKADATYVYVTNLITTLVSRGFVKVTPRGKFRVISLTDKGRELAVLLKKAKEKEES